jgi:uncharacterized alpha-E superfamily protein
VHLLLLEDPWIDEDTACRSLMGVMGSVPPPATVEVTRGDVLTSLAVDRANPSSIAYAVQAAARTRRAREIVSTELWETLNTTNSRMPRLTTRRRTSSSSGCASAPRSPSASPTRRRAGTRLAVPDAGAGDRAHRHDRAVLATRALTEASGPSWTTILRSCGAYEAYLRTYRGMPSASNAAEFLLLDRLFPRSVIHSITVAELHERDRSGRRPGRALEHRAARARAHPQRPRVPADRGDPGELPEHMEQVQKVTRQASEAIRDRFFPTHAEPSWIGETS